MNKKYKYIKESTEEEVKEVMKVLSKNIYNEYYFHLYGNDFLPDFTSKKNDGWAHKWMTIIYANKNVGMIRIYRSEIRENVELAIFVYEQFSNKGYGTKAIKELIELFPEIGIKNIILTTTSERLVKYYKRLGFKHVGTIENYSKLMDGKIYPSYSLQLLLK